MEHTVLTTIRMRLTLEEDDISKLLKELDTTAADDQLISPEFPALRDLHARLKNYAASYLARS